MSNFKLKRVKKDIPTDTYYRSLMKSILLIGMIVPLVPMILVSGIIYYQFHTSYKKEVRAHLKIVVQKGKQRIEHFLKDKLYNISMVAEICSYEQLRKESYLKEILRTLQRQHGPVFTDIGVTNAEGVHVAHTGPLKPGTARYLKADWYQKAMNGGHVISDVTPDLRNLPHFIIALRKGEIGKKWILWAAIDYETVSGVVEEVGTGKTGSAFILNRDRQYQTGPLNSINPGKDIFKGSLGLIGKVKGEISIVQRIGDSGHENIYVATFLKDGDWILVYRQVASKAFSGLKKAKTVALAAILIVSFLIGANAYSLAKRMVRRIAKADKEKQRLNEQMFQTGKLASIGELASGIAHEINNPVAIMVEEAGWIDDLLEEEEFQEGKNLNEFKRALKQIRTQGMRCKEITHKLLSFARKTDSRVQEVQPKELIQDMISFLEKRAKYSGVVINTNIQKDLPPIKVSPAELQQVLLNLINNALDAMEKSGGTLSISARRDGDNCLIEVSDNGPGIPKDDFSKIFDPFFTTKPSGKGTGLGLSICFGIIKKMGGEITFESAVDEGATFLISLPMKENA
ncbi:ATP-binding protein [Thermodesulfobacteriota bacterium]